MNGKELEKLRIEARLSQREVAEEIGVDRRTIGNCQKGIGCPNFKQVEILRELFNSKSEDNEKERLIVNLIDRLIEENIITDVDNIDTHILDLLINAIKTDIHIELKKR